MFLRKINFIFIILIASFFVSCDKERVFDQYEKLDGSWKKNDTILFSFEQKDTIKPYNLFLNCQAAF